MKLSWHWIRLRALWFVVPVFLITARPSVPLLKVGLVLAVAGGLLRAWASGTIRKNNVLTTGGPYAHTRNPLYLGTFLVGLGVTIAGGSWPFVVLFLAFFAIVYGRTMRAEERRLEELFGDRFREYAARVPLFIPRLRPYTPMEPHATEFLLRRYFLHREYEFALGVALGFLALAAKLVWL
ncbi:MAG TPA: isoprenylcysteine carboxylmethyltransferase family protein [Longimicrobiales bacterium]